MFLDYYYSFFNYSYNYLPKKKNNNNTNENGVYLMNLASKTSFNNFFFFNYAY